jgi:hypothetical protein
VFVPAFGLPGGPFVEGFGFGEADASSMKTWPLGSWQSMRSQKCGHPGFPAGFVFAEHAAGGFDFGPLARGGDAGAAGLPVAFAVFEGGKGEAELGGGFGGFDAEPHAIGGTGFDRDIGSVEDAVRILGVDAEGAITRNALSAATSCTFVGAMVEAPALGSLAGHWRVEGFGEERRTFVGTDLLMPVTMGWPPFQARL